MTTKAYTFHYYCKTRDTWLYYGEWFPTESKAKAFAESLKRDYPDVMGDYIIVWDMR